MILEPFGVSPRDVEADTVGVPAPRTYLGILDRPYNGLLNVGVETKMFLKGHFKDSTLTSLVWTVTGPTGSDADVSAAVEVDTATEVVSFIPDSTGTYTIVIAEGTYADTVTINAGTYLGIADGNCATCHTSETADWEGTGHYTIFEDGMNGIASSHYGSSCITCHTTGYDALADNGGFDDVTQMVEYLGKDTTFVYPDSATLVDVYGDTTGGHLFDGVYDSLEVFFPNSMKLARIQCESCHGPGSTHTGSASLSSDACAICHDSGTHHLYPEQWDASAHASSEPLSEHAATNSSCGVCHNGEGFVQKVAGKDVSLTEYTPITCATCHNTHNPTNNAHQLRTADATLASGEVVTEGGMGKLCMNCHRGREDADSYTAGPITSSHFGPHYASQADILMATNAVTFGRTLPSTPHLAATENACVDCHMYPGHADTLGNVILVGSHTFRMTEVTEVDTVDNVAACADCHGSIGDSFADKTHYIDHDGDGLVEGLQAEVHGLLDTLAALLPHPDTVAVYDAHTPVDSSWTDYELKAAFNHRLVYYDRSYGIHNPAFTVALLKLSIDILKDTALVAIEPGIDSGLPLEYALAQNYPNPFNPSTSIKFQIKESGHVTLLVYDHLGREVMRLVDRPMDIGHHSVTVKADRLASGVYFYRIRVNDFTDTRKMLLLK